jgi:MFS family permease
LHEVRAEAAAGQIAQVTQGTFGIGLVLVVRGQTGSLALAGSVVGAVSIAAGMARPVQGRFIDRHGAAALMAVCGVAHSGALAAIVLLAHLHAPAIALIGFGVLAGLALAPVSTAMRARWGALVPARDRTAAYSLVYLTQELSILTGPLVLSALIALADASVAMVCVAGLAAAGTLAFAALARGRTDDAAAELPRTGPVLGAAGVRVLTAVAALTGGVMGALEVGIPTLASAHRTPAASGLLLAAVAVGGIFGAVAYGSRRWSSPPHRRLLAALAVVTGAVAGTLAVTGLLVVGALLFVAGVAFNPALTTISLLVDRHVPAGGAAEAFGWLSLGIAGGTGAATAIAGAVTRHGDAHAAFAVGVVAGLAAATLIVMRRGLLERGGA